MEELPIAIEIPYEDPAIFFKIFSKEPWSFFLDSADSKKQREDTNRYSYIALDPFEKIVIKNNRRINSEDFVDNPFEYLKQIMSHYQLAYRTGLPPFQGGVLGYFSYDLCHYLEEINYPLIAEESHYADLAVGLYDVVISFDHVLQKSWIVSTGFPEKTRSSRFKKAKEQIAIYLDKLSKNSNDKYRNSQFKLEEVNLISPFNKNGYAELVKKAQKYILEGDIFEVNLSHRFQATLKPEEIHKYDLYLTMRACNPSPFSAYLNLGDHHILSTSPERFLLLQDKVVSTRPIKGTAPRGNSPIEDKTIADALVSSEKDCSENVMIADLLRNDLSKVCEPDSITVKKLCGLETYPTVHHLVTVIEGRLRQEITALDLLEACFPGGSITGAPKIRAMQIIYELEPTPRGPYCGSIGYIGFNNSLDTSIMIRTLLVQGDKISYQAGGAVVLDSSPEGEYEETIAKSMSIRKALVTQRDLL